MANQAPSGLKLTTDANGLLSIQNASGQTIAQGRVQPFTLTAGQNKTISVKEGDTLTVKSNTSTGTVQRLDANNNVIQTWTVNSGQFNTIGPYSGTSQFTINCTAGSIDVNIGDSTLSVLSKLPATEKLAMLKIPPVGFNYYSLLSDIYYNSAGASTSRTANLQYISDAGAKLVRVAFAGFAVLDYTTRIHNTGTMPATVSNSNLLPSFITACDTVMDALAQYGLVVMPCIAWGQATIPSAFAESSATAYGSTTSKTSVYVRSFAEWLINRYASHPALGLLSIGNEYLTDAAGVTNPTSAQLGSWFKYIADSARAVKPDLLVTSDITSPAVDLSRTRETLEQAVKRYRTIFAGLDLYNLHVYGDDYAFTGHMGTEVGTINNAYYSNLGYEGVESMMQAYADMARADGKPLIVGEFGISTNNEADDPGGANVLFLNDKKKWRFVNALVPYAHTSLIWNVQLTSIASASGNQSIWCIDPQSTTKRADQFKSISLAFNNGRTGHRNVGGALAARRNVIRPSVMMKSPNRGAGINVKFTTTAAHQSSTGYAVMFWFQLNLVLNNAETIVDFRNSTTAGFVLLAALVANNQTFYSDGRYASGSSGNTSNALPDFPLNESHHVCFQLKQFNVNGTITNATEIWLNGVYWLTVGGGALPASIPVGTTAYVLGNSGNGVPMKMQDFALFPSVTKEEIWDHMAGAVSNRAMLHVRANEDGTILDVSKNATALTVTGVTVSVEK